MATRIKPADAAPELDDFYAWSKGQAALMRAGRFADLDLERLIEEIDDLGESLYRSACSRVRTIIEHLLMLPFSHAGWRRPGWIETLYTQRTELEGELTPSLRPRVEQALARLHGQARRNTARTLEAYGEQAAADALPATCPYTFDQITGDWLP